MGASSMLVLQGACGRRQRLPDGAQRASLLRFARCDLEQRLQRPHAQACRKRVQRQSGRIKT